LNENYYKLFLLWYTMSAEPEAVGLVMRGEDTNTDNHWNTCCGKTSDRRLLQFIASLSISLLVLIFSAYQLSQHLDCASEQVYIGLVTLIIGFWVKSPISD
jgi:hypothetical protein